MEWYSSAFCRQRGMFLLGRTHKTIRIFALPYKELCTLHSAFSGLPLFWVQHPESSLQAILSDGYPECSSAGWTLEWLQHSGQLPSSHRTAPSLELNGLVLFAFPLKVAHSPTKYFIREPDYNPSASLPFQMIVKGRVICYRFLRAKLQNPGRSIQQPGFGNNKMMEPKKH